MQYKVIEITDGDTFKVTPKWSFNGTNGSAVRANGYNTPEEGEPGYKQAREKLRNLIGGNNVELRNKIKLTYGRLLCDVYFNERNLKDYFKEYQ
jgi:endonuclease YncB( thermonuclease family)